MPRRPARPAPPLALALALAGPAACVSYSPPVRSVDYGAPGRLRQGDLEVAGGFTAVGATPAAGGGFVGYGVRDWASVEAGVDGSLDGWLMGYGGGRLTHAPRRERRFHPAVDGELGLGFGAGGHCYQGNTDCAPEPWHRRAAFGGYVGGGAAYHLAFFALYARARANFGLADGLPITLWGAVRGGVQARIADHVDLFSAVGYGGLVTGQHRHAGGLTWTLGVSVHFGLARPGGGRGR